MTLLGAQVVVAGSHHRYKEIAERFDDPEAPRGSVNIDLEGCIAAMPELFEQAMIAHLEAGDVFVWDDRTLHCNVRHRRNWTPFAPPNA